MKKFEEGIFSDLRRLSPPQDCQLETTRSDFLVYLFNTDCVRSKKKQKVFFWTSFARCANALFCDAFEREMARIEMARAVGMSIDEFIKSGIVPTGGAGSNADSGRLGFDWTLVRPGPSDYRAQSMDQIHVIRNDIANCFARNLRQLVGKRASLVTEEVEIDVQEDLSKRTGGADVSLLRKSAPTDAASESVADSNDDGGGGDSDFSPYVRRRRAPPAAKSSPLTPRTASSTSGSGRTRPTSITTTTTTTTTASTMPTRSPPTLDPYFAPDDNYSVSTLSSDDEEDRSFLPRNFQHRAPTTTNHHRQTAASSSSIYSRHPTFRYAIWPPATMVAKHPAAAIPPNYAYPPSKNGESAAELVVVDRMQTPMEYLRSDVKLPRPAMIQLDVSPATEDIIGSMLRLSSPPEIHSVVYHNVATHSSTSTSTSTSSSSTASKGKRPLLHEDGDDAMLEPISDSSLDANHTSATATTGGGGGGVTSSSSSPGSSDSGKRQKTTMGMDFATMAGWSTTTPPSEETMVRPNIPGAQEAANILLGISRG